MVVLLSLTGCGSNRYEWHFDHTVLYSVERGVYRLDPEHVAAENGRVREYVVVSIRHGKNPFRGWDEVLVELCDEGDSAGSESSDGMPCWPRERRPRISQQSLARIYARPGYRDVSSLFKAAEVLNREVAPFQRAYLVGTQPLAVAFFDEHPDVQAYRALSDAATTRPTTRPGVYAIGGRGTTKPDLMDLRRREVEWVSLGNHLHPANVVLLYPAEMHVAQYYRVVPDPRVRPMRARLLILRQPRPVEYIVNLLTYPEAMEREVQHVVDLPVRAP